MAKLDALETTTSNRFTHSRGIDVSPHEVNAALHDDPITMQDLKAALEATKPSTQFLSEKYLRWEKEHGSV